MKTVFRLQTRKMQERMDTAGAVDAQNAPTAPWKTAQSAVSHSAHTHRRQYASHTKFRTLPKRPAFKRDAELSSQMNRASLSVMLNISDAERDELLELNGSIGK
jgi:hypothetical protein